MYFLFFVCEAKCEIKKLDVVNKQNAHSMIIIVKNIVKLFKLVNRENEFHRKIFAFSNLHDVTIVKIYDHYALIKDRAVKFYRHFIHKFSFTIQNDKNK